MFELIVNALVLLF